MASVNKVILIGNLGKDPETRYMSNGDAVTTITLATTDTWKDKNSEKQEKTEWHRGVFYRKLAEIVGEYFKKGRSVYVEGRLETKKWTDKQGVERYTTQVIADSSKCWAGSQAVVTKMTSQKHQLAQAAAVIAGLRIWMMIFLFKMIRMRPTVQIILKSEWILKLSLFIFLIAILI